MVNLDYKNDYPTHTFLIYKEDKLWCWFENSDYNNRGIHKFNSYDELIDYQYNKYVEYLKTYNVSDEEINSIILTKFNKPKEHISAKDYLNHAINSKRIKGVD